MTTTISFKRKVIVTAILAIVCSTALFGCGRGSRPPANLHDAAVLGDVSATKKLIKEGDDVNAKDWRESTPVQLAVRYKEPRVAKILLDNGARVDLYIASGLGDLAAVRKLVHANTKLVNLKDKDGETPLHWAAMNGHYEVVKYLVTHGAQVGAKASGYQDNTPLHDAALNGHQRVVEYLVSKGAEVDAKKTDGATPLIDAAAYARYDVVEYLLANGANVNAADVHGFSALRRAADRPDVELAELLLKNGADPNTKDVSNCTPLHVAAMQGDTAMAKLLIKAGASKTRRDVHGRTPFQTAQAWRHNMPVLK